MSADDHSPELRLQLVAAFLRSHSTMMLSTCDADGWPQVTPLFYYVGDDLGLYWFSSRRSAHSRQVVREPRVAVAVSNATEHWQEIRGVQMRGEALVVSGEIRKKIAAQYRDRFHLGAMFSLVMAQSSLFRFQPSWIRYLDNAKGMGYKFEVTLPVPADGVAPG